MIHPDIWEAIETCFHDCTNDYCSVNQTITALLHHKSVCVFSGVWSYGLQDNSKQYSNQNIILLAEVARKTKQPTSSDSQLAAAHDL